MASIQEAVDAYKRNPEASISSIADTYEVPRGTLWSRIYGKNGVMPKQRGDSPGAEEEETSPERPQGNDENDDQGEEPRYAVVVERNPNARQSSEGPTKRSRHDVDSSSIHSTNEVGVQVDRLPVFGASH
jgi:helix-turn-helix, Psq domain